MKISLLTILLLVNAGWACAADINDQDAVYAVIGEAEGESFIGKIAVACAIRNRGNLNGVYGYTAPRVRRHLYNKVAEQQSVDAWIMSDSSSNCDFIGGATEWRSKKIKGELATINSKEFKATVDIGGHRFYRKR